MIERRRGRSPLDGLRPLLPLAVVWSAGYGLLLALAMQRTIPHEALLLDPSAYGRLPWYTGLVSQLGILGWTTAAVVGAGGAWIALVGGRPGAARLLAGAAVFTAVLTLDDLFQLHIVIPDLLGVPKSATYLVHLTIGGAWAAGNLREVIRTRWILLTASAVTFGVSVGIDRYGARSGVGLLAEDGFKFLGILAWGVYVTSTAADIVRSVLSPIVVEATPPDGAAAMAGQS